MAKVFCWCSLNLENFWFSIWVVAPWLNFTKQITLPHFLPMPINKIVRRPPIYSKCWEKSVKRKSNISFRVIIHLLINFLKIIWWRFLLSRSEYLLVSSATLSCKTQNILTLSMLVYYNKNSFFLRDFSLTHLLLVCSSSLIIKVLSEIHFEVSLFQVAP